MPLFFLYAALLAGCATGGGSTPPREAPAVQRYNLTGYSAAFKAGYADACERKRDDQRLQSDGDYRMGWNDGRSLCRR